MKRNEPDKIYIEKLYSEGVEYYSIRYRAQIFLRYGKSGNVLEVGASDGIRALSGKF